MTVEESSFLNTETSAAGQKREPHKQDYMRRVPAADQTLQILFALANSFSSGATLTELAAHIGISRSKALALLNTLRLAGLVNRNDKTKIYRLGLSILVLSRALMRQTDLAREVTPYLEELAAETGSAVHAGVISGDTVYVIARRQAPGSTYASYDVGTRYPATFGAHGRAVLACLSDEEFEAQLAQGSLLQEGKLDRNAVDPDVLRAQVKEARELGYGLCHGTTYSGMNSVGVALTIEPSDAPGTRHAAAVLYAVGSFSVERAHVVGERMREMALEMSRALEPLLRSTDVHFPDGCVPKYLDGSSLH